LAVDSVAPADRAPIGRLVESARVSAGQSQGGFKWSVRHL
jgi:hypothetical protein